MSKLLLATDKGIGAFPGSRLADLNPLDGKTVEEESCVEETSGEDSQQLDDAGRDPDGSAEDGTLSKPRAAVIKSQKGDVKQHDRQGAKNTRSEGCELHKKPEVGIAQLKSATPQLADYPLGSGVTDRKPRPKSCGVASCGSEKK